MKHTISELLHAVGKASNFGHTHVTVSARSPDGHETAVAVLEGHHIEVAMTDALDLIELEESRVVDHDDRTAEACRVCGCQCTERAS